MYVSYKSTTRMIIKNGVTRFCPLIVVQIDGGCVKYIPFSTEHDLEDTAAQQAEQILQLVTDKCVEALRVVGGSV